MKQHDYRVTSVEVLDWYDGLVSGVVSLENGGTYLALLQAFDPAEDQRIYALFSVSEVIASQLQLYAGSGAVSELSSSWDAMERIINDAIALCVDDVLLTRGKVLEEGGQYSFVVMVDDGCAQRITWSVDAAVEPDNLVFWQALYSAALQGCGRGGE